MVAQATVDELVARHSNELFGYLVRFVGNRAVAEDLLGDVLVKMMEQHQTSVDAEFAWRPWLYRVATNQAISHLRKEKIRQWVGLDGLDVAADECDASVHIDAGQSGQRIQRAIARLSPKLKSTLMLSVYQGLSYKEIAEVERIEVGTVKSRLNEAKRVVKCWLEESHG